MTAGRRDQLITFQRGASTDDGYSSTVDWSSPTTLGSEWAAINYGRGDERRQAAMVEAAQPGTFNVLDNEVTRAVQMADRIKVGEEIWDIKSNVPGKKRGERDITAVRAG